VSQVFGVGDLGPEPAAFVEPMSIAVHALGRAGIPDGEQVIVLGAGPIGLATVLAATAAGARVMATDPVPARRDLALTMGAENAAWGGDGGLIDAVQAWTHGPGAPGGVATTAAPVAQATRLVWSAGRVVVVGMSAAAAPLRSGVFPEKEIDVLGSSCATAADFRSAVALAQAHRETIAALFSHRFPLTRAQEAIECVANPAAGAVRC
jgi:L-gulonate 5-dehydrogenase